MKGKFSKTEMRGLPGGPNEQFTYVTGVFMQDMYHAPIAQKGGEGYRIDAPNYNDPSKIIKGKKGNPTNITMTEQDGGPLKKGPLLGIDNMGNQQMMFPGYEYQFPGDMVMEIPLRKAQLGEEPANTYMPYDKFRDSSDAYKYLAALNAAEKRRTELIKEAVVDEKGRKIIPIELQKRIAEDPILKWSTGAGGLKNVMPYEMFIDKFGEENLWKLEEEFLKNYSDDTKYYYENKLEDINNLFGDLSHPDYSVGRRGDILPSTNALYDTSKHSLYGTTLPIGEDYSEIEDKYNKELRVRKSLDESYQQDYGKSYDEVMKPIYASGKYPKSESQKLYWNPETNTPEWHYPSENPEKLKYWEELKEKERDEFSRFIKEYRNNNGINTDVYQTLPYKPGEDNFNNSLQNLPSQDDNTTTKEKPQLYSSPRQLNISTNIRSQPRDIGIQIGKPKINKDPDPGTRAWRDMMRAKTDEEKSLWQKAKQDGGGVKFNPYARAFPINEDIKAIVGDIGMRTNFKNKPAYINTSIKPTFGYIPEGPNIFDLKGEASVGMRSGDFNTELGVSKNFMRQDDPSLIGSIGYNTEKFGINASSNIPTKKNPNFFPSVNIRYNPNENLSIFGEGQYDSISKSPSFRTGLNYRFKQKGGEDEFNRILKKYTTKGWDFLSPQEQQFYRDNYKTIIPNKFTLDENNTLYGTLPTVSVTAPHYKGKGEDITRRGVLNDLGTVGTQLAKDLYEFTSIPTVQRIYMNLQDDPWSYAKAVKGFGKALVNRATSPLPYHIPTPEEMEVGDKMGDLLEVAPGIGVLGKGAKTAGKALTTGPLKNTYKFNPKALKENPEAYLYRAQEIGQDPYKNMAAQLREKEAAGEQLKWYQKNLLNPQTDPRMIAREKYYGQWFENDPSRLPYYLSSDKIDEAGEILRIKLPKSEVLKSNISNFDDAKILSLSPETEFILPKSMIESAERFSPSFLQELIQQDEAFNTPHWLWGYKKTKQTGGEFQRLVNKYTTKGWQSLTDQEKQTYKEMYQQYK